jgi:Phytanoyl-CoA dioxygenase (PhyH)
MLVPGSHREQVPRTETGVLGAEAIAQLCRRQGITAVSAPAGSVVYFDGQVVHGSAPNVTPFDRRVLYITYNHCDNAPDLSGDAGELPPDHTCARGSTPLSPLGNDETQLGLCEMRKPTFLEDADYSLSAFDTRFDFINVHSVFTHAPANHIRRCLSQARATMHEKSVFVATYLASEKDHVGEEFVYQAYLRDEIEAYGGSPRSYAEYLRAELDQQSQGRRHLPR